MEIRSDGVFNDQGTLALQNEAGQDVAYLNPPKLSPGVTEDYKAALSLVHAARPMYDALQDALNVLECNCGATCRGTCTRGLCLAAIALADKIED